MKLPLYDTREGVDIVTRRDSPRLQNQMVAIKSILIRGGWHTLQELEKMTGFPQASISAQLRHLRKKRFGGHIIDRRHLGGGLYEYRLRANGSLGF